MKTLKIIGKVLYALLVAGVVFVAAVIFLPIAKIDIPYSMYSIDSGSMTPTIPVGSVVLVEEKQEYQPEDVITFRQENNAKKFVTHRVVDVERDNDIGKYAFITRGDANNANDPEPVDSSRVVGKVLFHIPLVGYPVAFAKTQNGFIALVVIPATLIIYQELATIKNEVAKMIASKKTKPIPTTTVVETQAPESETQKSAKQATTKSKTITKKTAKKKVSKKS